MAYVIEHSRFQKRLGVCLDTAHLFAAGYDFRTPTAYRDTVSRLDEVIGLERIRFFHLNDSLREFGSRVDRHTHIGKGALGRTLLKRSGLGQMEWISSMMEISGFLSRKSLSLPENVLKWGLDEWTFKASLSL